MKNKIGEKEKPMHLKTPPGTSEFTMYTDEKDGMEILVCTVGKTVLHYQYRCLADLHAMLKKHGDWMELGSADEQKPAKEGTVEAWGRSSKKPGRRMVWSEEGIARQIWNVYSAIDGGAGTCGTDARGER
ncbi:MAG: DUF6855 family protein [Puia sp.]